MEVGVPVRLVTPPRHVSAMTAGRVEGAIIALLVIGVRLAKVRDLLYHRDKLYHLLKGKHAGTTAHTVTMV